MTGQEERADRATLLDGPGAIVSHAEALAAWETGLRTARAVGDSLGVSASTARRLLRRLAAAGLLETAGGAR